MLLLSSMGNHGYCVMIFFSAQNYTQVRESGLISVCTICIWVIRIIVNEYGYQCGTFAPLKIGSDLCLHVSISLWRGNGTGLP